MSVIKLDGSRLVTMARGRGFTVHASLDRIEYIPDSSGHPRPDSWERIALVIDRYNETRSKLPGDYQDLTYDASYVLALLAHVTEGASTDNSPPVASPSARASPEPDALGSVQRPHQRVGALSNAHVGRDFEDVALEYFRSLGIELERDFSIELGLTKKKIRRFDLGTSAKKIKTTESGRTQGVVWPPRTPA